MRLLLFFSSRRRHTSFDCDWSSDVCSSDLRRSRGRRGHRRGLAAGLPRDRWPARRRGARRHGEPRAALRGADRGGLGRSGRRTVARAACPPWRAGIRPRAAALRPALRSAQARGHRLLPLGGRRERVPGLRPPVRAAGGRAFRRSQLRGLVVRHRADRRRDADGLVPGGRRRGPGRHRHPADRLLRAARGPRPRRAGRLLPHGRHRRARGLTCDNLTAAQIVTADGRLLDCDSRRNADLFWACRGGGGGNFGVATSLTFGAHRLSALTLFFLSWPWSQAAQVVSGWQSWAPYQGDELWSNLHLSAAPGTRVPLSVQVGGTFLGSPAEAAAALEKLTAAVGSAPSGEPFELPYLDAMLAEAGCGERTAGQCHLPAQAPGGRLGRQPQFAKSDFVTRPLPPAGIAVLLAAAEQFLGIRTAAQATGAIAFDACGGAINRVHPAATAFVHRDALFLIQYTTTWAAGSRGGGAAGGAAASGAAAGSVVNSGAARQRDWQHALHASMRPYVSGQAYQNYIDPELAGWRQAYYGANYRRLARIKAAYDPGRLFRFPQGISPAR